MKKKIILFSLIVIILLVFITVYFILPIKSSQNLNETTGNSIKDFDKTKLDTLEINENVITKILLGLGLEELHNIILTSNTPKIEIKVDDKNFNAEVKNNKIITKKGSIEEEDIMITMTRKDVIDFINSSYSLNSITNSLNQGTMKIEQKSSVKTLFLKGYLGIYKKFTGKDLEVK